MTRKSLLGWLLGWSVVVMVSVVWHFPASYLLNLPAVKKTLPPGLVLNQVQGAWWKANMQVTWQDVLVGNVQWQWRPSELLVGSFGLGLNWKNSGQTLALRLKTDGEAVQVFDINGQVKLDFISRFNPNLALLNGAQGEVILKNLMLESPLQNPWPTKVSGQLAVVDVNAMGMVINTAEVQPSLDEKTLVFSVQARDKGWTLSGKTLLMQPNRFDSQYQLTANSAEEMPSWVSLMMRQTSPTEAQLKGRGTW